MKKELDDYLYELTMNLKAGSDERFSAYQIAESLQLNRSTISSYLNQAFRDGELVKIKSYPVLFLHRKALEDASVQISKVEYDSLEELFSQDNTDILSSHYEWQEQKNELLEFLDSFLETPFWYAKKLLTYLSQQLDQQILEEDIVFVTFYFYSLQISDLPNDVKCIVLAHGYSTASSLANVVNRMLGKNVFQAYDMPINITLDKVEAQIIRYINDYRTDSGLILLVDMGSFNQLGERLSNHIKSPLVIIDNVSTPLVLEVGQHIISGDSVTEVYEAINVENRIQKQLIIPELNKKKAIITCCYTGIGSATQIQEILLKCLGDSAKELTILPYDYHKLSENKMYETPFQLYDVLMIVGTENPKINQVPYIGLDQLINGEAVGEFAELLHEQVDIDSEAFKNQLIFNFSINKIVENLTILDATKVLRLVQKAVQELERLMAIEFSNNQLFLLYMHCCSMIERILRKESVDEQADIEEYVQKEGHNMELIHQAFQEVEKEYTIELPLLELRLLNDIVKD